MGNDGAKQQRMIPCHLDTNWFMGPTRGPPVSCRPQVGPMLYPSVLLSGWTPKIQLQCYHRPWWLLNILWPSCNLSHMLKPTFYCKDNRITECGINETYTFTVNTVPTDISALNSSWTSACLVLNLILTHAFCKISSDTTDCNYRQTSTIMCTLVSNIICWSLRCSWSIACGCCHNYIFILNLSPGFNGLYRDKCKTRRETFQFWDLVPMILKLTHVILPTC